ncbi:MAG: hypothetical protein HYR67_15355 [Bacteroidetes bacterium]|nr:hypothetical protein [Bacteroidota bacterium]
MRKCFINLQERRGFGKAQLIRATNHAIFIESRQSRKEALMPLRGNQRVSSSAPTSRGRTLLARTVLFGKDSIQPSAQWQRLWNSLRALVD